VKAAVRTEEGTRWLEVETPRPAATEILVKVRACSLNRADLALVDGRAHGAHGGPGTRLGLEWSGDVVEVGSDVTAFAVGDKAMCSGVGGFAEYAVTDWRRAFAFPARPIGYEAAACLPISLRTTCTALAVVAKLQRGETVLVLGASSGVGLMTLQVAKELGAGLVIGTSTNPARRARLAEFGADAALDSNDAAWVEQVQALTGGRGVDVAVDFLAGPLLNDCMRAVAIGGRIVNVGRMAGESGPFDFDLHSMRRIQYLGTTFRTRTLEEVRTIANEVRERLWPALEAGRLGVPIDVRLPLDQVAEACELMRRNAHFGKIVLA
jgi:NADPH2:quinone reductase